MRWDFPYDSPSQITELLDRHGLAMSRRFGQNFLLSKEIRTRIVSALELDGTEHVWEIGPGIGNITSYLIDSKADITAFEIDRGFISILRDHAFKDVENFTLIEGDFLKTWESVLAEKGTPDVICGNLPYNVGSVIIGRLLEKQVLPKKMAFTLQKEVIGRITGESDTKNWSTLSILSQVDFEVKQLFTIKAGAFYPPPNVDSAVILNTRRDTPLVPDEKRELFFTIVHDLFSSRRKTMRNNLLHGSLASSLPKEKIIDRIEQSQFDPMTRGEVYSIAQLLELTDLFLD
ncbi:MAG: 16S rRNA (adenine(1518)-N(6)/adenine(1519)-N(6))-dimethyltransferase RsmA [Sphaerochaetaceae bacterium]|nr:16S rRNA (adenine(1518)-N(6)/adenine(1519)-N(6))-dimethyltransferase RsmA [Sphaerochaetaceae bacterium]